MRAPSFDSSIPSTSSTSSAPPPLLPALNTSVRSAAESFDAAASSATQRGMDNFLALQQAMYETYSSLPPEAQMALLRRSPTVADASVGAPSSSPSPSPATTASTSYLSSREATINLSRSNSTTLPQRSSLHRSYDSRSRSTQSTPNWAHIVPSSSSHPQAYKPPPAPIHRVYILRCASCDTFLTDRGMRAVLLLKPNIVLFSTDATPSNSGPIWPDGRIIDEPVPERTCECLTSSLGCQGCGAVVGYHIVQPCVRCTASVQKHQRSANHHRYVFHHNEVVSHEREYFPGESGIIGSRYIPPSCRSTSSTPAGSPVPAPTPFPQSETDYKDSGVANTLRDRSNLSDPARRPAATEPAKLRAGDTIYWHNLVSGGERTKPVDPDTRPLRSTQRPGR